MTTRYYIRLPNPDEARGNDVELSFHSRGAAGFAEELQDALRGEPPRARARHVSSSPMQIRPAFNVSRFQA